MDRLHETPINSIRKYCIDVCSLITKEVRSCTCIVCSLYASRIGTRPSEETLKTLEDYFSKNPKPIKEV